MSSPESETTGKVIEFAGELAGLVKAEWRDRTRFGKLLFPFWLLNSAIQWSLVLLLIGSALYIDLANEAIDSAIDATWNALPDTHEGER